MFSDKSLSCFTKTRISIPSEWGWLVIQLYQPSAYKKGLVKINAGSRCEYTLYGINYNRLSDFFLKIHHYRYVNNVIEICDM